MEFFVHINVTPNEDRSRKEVTEAVKRWFQEELEKVIQSLVKDRIITEGEAHIFKATYLIGVMS